MFMNNGTTSAYSIRTPSLSERTADFHDCRECGAVISTPVFLAHHGAAAGAYGTGCAARLLGYARTANVSAAVRNRIAAEVSEQQARAEVLADRSARAAAYLARFDDFDTPLAPGHESLRRAYISARTDLKLSAWLAVVAETGEFPGIKATK